MEKQQCMCRICGGHIQRRIKQYGVEGVCQPCALFFRRSLNKNLVCSGSEGCRLFAMRHQLSGDLQSIARTACKSCRLTKCLELGMRNEKMVALQQLENLAQPLQPVAAADVHNLLSCLRDSESRAQILFGKACVFRESLPPRFDSLRQVLLWNGNLIEETCRIAELTDESAHSMLSTIAANGNFSTKSQPILSNLISITENFKTLPFFHKLDLNDQIRLLNYLGAPLYDLCSKYYSSLVNSDVVVHKHPSGISPLWVYQSPYYRGDQTIHRLSNHVFRTSMEAFNRVKLDETEFLLLKIIVAAHSATSGLSADAITLLQSEAENYAGLLMSLSRKSFGEPGGIRRYAEILQLAESVFRSAQKKRELVTYVAMVTDQFRFHAMLPRAFINMCLHGEGSE